MGLMQRFSTIFKAKASKTLDRYEDPRETLDHSYERTLQMLQKMRRAVATSRKRVELQARQLQQSAAKLDGRPSRPSPASLAVGSKDDYCFGVPKDREIGVVGAKEKLALPLGIADAGHDAVSDEGIVEVVFGLIDNEWVVRLQQHEQEECSRLLAGGELAAWVRRDEEYATLGAAVVVELNSESRTRRPTTRAWAIIRRAHRAHQRTSDRQQRGERRHVDRASRTDRTGRPPAQGQEREVVGGAR